MPAVKSTNSLTRDTLRKIVNSKHATDIQKQLAQLRIAYSEDAKLLTGYVNQLQHVNRVHPTHWPGQASGRWSTFDPPITNWPRACINPTCQATLTNLLNAGETLGYIEHESTDICWSVRDILLPDDDEILITWDHDNIEGRIHDLIVEDTTAIQAHKEGYDLHTITCCKIFGHSLPTDLINPHSGETDEAWRRSWTHGWQGKDTKQRVLAKNFNHGSKYTEGEFFVRRIGGIEKYGVSQRDLIQLARAYIASKGDAWTRKLDIMRAIGKHRVARSLYGFRRVFYDSSPETRREGFSHMISSTVSDYNNMTLQMLEQRYGDIQRLLHNAHDGDKVAFKLQGLCDLYGVQAQDFTHIVLPDFKRQLAQIIIRPISYHGSELLMTASIKVHLTAYQEQELSSAQSLA